MIHVDKKPFELITAATCCANLRTPTYTRRDYEVCSIEYITAGGGYLENNGGAAEYVGVNDIFILAKHSSHSYYPDRNDPWEKIFFVVDGFLMESIMHSCNIADGGVIHAAGDLKHFFLEFLAMSQNRQVCHKQAALLFHEFANGCEELRSRSGSRSAAPQEKLRQVLEQNFAEPLLLKEYARQNNFSCEHLIRLFRNQYKITPQAYRLQRRMEEACRLLGCSELSVKELASMLGFSDQYSFSNSFKKHCGISPSVYRKKLRG